MKYLFWVSVVLIGVCASVNASAAFDHLSSQPVSRFDLAFVKIQAELQKWKDGNPLRMVQKDLSVRYASVGYDDDREEIIIHTGATSVPSQRICQMLLNHLIGAMSLGKAGGDAELPAKLFYSKFFMPATAGGVTYEPAFYEEVFKRTLFRATVTSGEGDREIACEYRGFEGKPRFYFNKL